jgi:S-adenosyl-L-methionine hydrolase (adenosine-forming)
MLACVPIVTFLSDYGLADTFVGQCHAVLARLAPAARVVDLTHAVPPQDIMAGALLLAECLAVIPEGVTLAVVDPGVGTERRPVGLRTGAGHWFVGPDNGLFTPVLDSVVEAWHLHEPPGIPATFHGRDLFAPAAADLAAARTPRRLGRRIDPSTLTRLTLSAATVTSGRLRAPVTLVDHYGNCALAATAADLAAAGLHPGEPVGVLVAHPGARAPAAIRGAGPVAAVVGRTFADVPQGAPVVLVDSAGRVALAVNGGSAAAVLGLVRGGEVVLTRPAGP